MGFDGLVAVVIALNSKFQTHVIKQQPEFHIRQLAKCNWPYSLDRVNEESICREMTICWREADAGLE
jgi:hypothetical protein